MNEIHQSFIKSLFLVAIVTLVSMVSARYFISSVLSRELPTQSFTIQKSQDTTDR